MMEFAADIEGCHLVQKDHRHVIERDQDFDIP